MKEIKYTILPPLGNMQTHTHGTVKDLLFDVPYFFSTKDIIPPRHILNDFLQRGINDAGMSGGCRWKPFELSENEYDELVEELLTEPFRELSLVEVPNDVKTYDQWFQFRIRFRKISSKNLLFE